jgi:predicted AlkP superfamily pyrophosphatase or phosphodiesterase
MNQRKTNRVKRLQWLIGLLLLNAFNAPIAQAGNLELAAFEKRPKLVVLIVFDQMRADYLTRFTSRFLHAVQANQAPGGFRWFMEKGTFYPQAEYELLHSMTGPGHATLLSGSYPYQMGISGNYWFDREAGKSVYCVSDPASSIVGAGDEATKLPGMSPKNFLGTTVGDELKNSGRRSRVVTLALKDRAAILMGGYRADLALWYEPKSGSWVSSRHYLKDGGLPSWVSGLNQRLLQEKGQPFVWGGSGKPTGLSSNDSLKADWKKEEKRGSKESLASPYGVQITVDAALSAVKELGLGKAPDTDILAVSFSSHDYLAHTVGAQSREMEEMTAAEDRELSRLLAGIQKQLPSGLDQTVVVLSADHGAPQDPDWLSSQKLPAGRFSTAKLAEGLEAELSKQFGKPPGGKWIQFATHLQMWLAPEVLELYSSPEKRQAIDRAAEKFLLKNPIVTHFMSRSSEVASAALPPGQLGTQLLNTWYPGRSGDWIIVPRANFFEDGQRVDHMTGYAYDRVVPLAFVGKPFRPGVRTERARMVDLAPTLSFILGVTPPAQCEGRVLGEGMGK